MWVLRSWSWVYNEGIRMSRQLKMYVRQIPTDDTEGGIELVYLNIFILCFISKVLLLQNNVKTVSSWKMLNWIIISSLGQDWAGCYGTSAYSIHCTSAISSGSAAGKGFCSYICSASEP